MGLIRNTFKTMKNMGGAMLRPDTADERRRRKKRGGRKRGRSRSRYMMSIKPPERGRLRK